MLLGHSSLEASEDNQVGMRVPWVFDLQASTLCFLSLQGLSTSHALQVDAKNGCVLSSHSLVPERCCKALVLLSSPQQRVFVYPAMLSALFEDIN